MKLLSLVFLVVFLCIIPAFGQMDILTTDQKLYALKKEGKFDEAIADLNNRIKLQPDKGELYLRRADFLRLQNKLDKAILDVSQAIEIEPQNPTFYLARAEFFNLAKNNEAVLKDVLTALSLDSDNRGTLRSGAKQLFIGEQYNENIKIADSYISRSYSTDELKSFAYKIRSENKYAIKDYAGALEDAIKSIELFTLTGDEGKDGFARYVVADLTENIILPVTQNHLKSNKEIFDYYNQIFAAIEGKVLPSFEQERQRSVTLFSRINPNKPEENAEKRRYNEQHTFSPVIGNFRRLMLDCAELYAEKGQPEKGIELFERIIKLKPAWVGYLRRARFYKKLEKYKESINDLNFAIFEELKCPNLPTERDGSNVWNCPGISIEPGDFYALTNQFDKAVETYEKEKVKAAKQKTPENVNQPR